MEVNGNNADFRTRLFETSPLPMVIVDAQTARLTDANLAAAAIYGYDSPEQLRTRSISDLSPQLQSDGTPSAQKAVQYLTTAFKRGAAVYEWQHLRKSGEVWDSNVHLQAFATEPQQLLQCTIIDTSYYKQIEAARIQSESKYRSIIESSPMGMHLYELMPDNRLVFTGANPAANTILGVDNTIFIGKTIEDAFPPLADTEIPARYREVATTGITWQTEQVNYSDEKVQGAFYVVAFRTSEHCMAAMFLDVTRQKQYEHELSLSEDKYRTLFTTMSQGVVYQNAQGVILSANPAAERILGLSLNQMQGRTSIDPRWKAIHEDGSEYPGETHPILITLRTGEIVKNAVMGIYHPEKGHHVWIKVTSVPVFRKGETKPFQAYAVIEDITERKLAVDALQASERRFKELVKNASDSITILNKEGIQIYVSDVVEKMLGFTPEELTNIPVIETMIHPDDRSKVEEAFKRILTDKCGGGQYRHRHKNGSWVHLEAWGTNQLDNPDIRGVVVNVRDITERVQAAEEREKLNYQLNQMQKLESLGLLAGGIAHDFNNLLGGIFGYIDLASFETDACRVSDYLEKALHTIERARALTGQLLTFAKGGAPIQKHENLFPFVRETAEFALSGANVICNFTIDNNLWTSFFDKNQIGQVIDNIIINAQQAMPLGGTIEIRAHNISLGQQQHAVLAAGDYIRISIKDMGIGIPRELFSKIFDPFFTTKTKGHGLGLATCYSIIKRHGGSIDVESEPGKGSTFHIYLPASTQSVSTSAEIPNTMHRGTGTFLIMDDEDVVRDTVHSMLKRFGYNVVGKENGNEAVTWFAAEIAANRPVAGMIFDLTVPGGMGGKEAIAEIRKLDTTVPVFVASGYADDPVMKCPADFGFSASICKPFRTAELSAMLNGFLKQE